MKHFLLLLIWLSFGGALSAQDGKALYLKDDGSECLLADHVSMSIYDREGAYICFYMKSWDEEASFSNWSDHTQYPATTTPEDFRQEYGFGVLLEEIDDSLLLCQVIVTDSIEGEMKPCGQAEYAEPVMFYDYTVRISIDDQVVVENQFRDHSFNFRFDQKGHERGFQRNVQAWKAPDGDGWFVNGADRFLHVPPQ